MGRAALLTASLACTLVATHALHTHGAQSALPATSADWAGAVQAAAPEPPEMPGVQGPGQPEVGAVVPGELKMGAVMPGAYQQEPPETGAATSGAVPPEQPETEAATSGVLPPEQPETEAATSGAEGLRAAAAFMIGDMSFEEIRRGICKEGFSPFRQVNKWDNTRCTLLCAPVGACESTLAAWQELNKMKPGTCRELGYTHPGHFRYRDELDATIEWFPQCQGMTSHSFTNDQATTTTAPDWPAPSEPAPSEPSEPSEPSAPSAAAFR